MRILILLLSVILSSCSSLRRGALPAENSEILVVASGDSRIGTYVSSWPGFRTSSYWIEGPTGLILIDTQFLLSAAENALNEAERRTGKKVELAIVLHPNPDKFNGAGLYRKRGIRVLTSTQIAKLIPSVHELRKGWFYQRFKPDYPAELPPIESFGDHTTELSAGGITVKVHVLGAGCSDAHIAVQFERNLFVGDLVTIGFHSWLELGKLKEWTQRLDELAALKPTYVRTGRGGSGDSDAIVREKEYLNTVMTITRNLKRRHRNQPYRQEWGRQITEEVVRRYPAYDYPIFVTNGLEALWNQTRIE